MRVLGLFLLWSYVACTGVHAAAPDAFAATAPVVPAAGEGVHRLQLPLAVLQASRSPQLADLRIFNERGEALPLAGIPPSREAATRESLLPLFPWPQPVSPGQAPMGLRVQVDAAGAVVRIEGGGVMKHQPSAPREWLLDATSRRGGERLASLTLDWPPAQQGITLQLTLQGSDDFRDWHDLGSTVLVDVPSATHPRVLRNQLNLEGSAAVPKYLRVRLDQPLALRGVQAEWRSSAVPAMDGAHVAFARSADAQQTAWQVDLKAALEVRRLAVQLPQANTVVLTWLEQRNEGDRQWRPLSRHTLYRMHRNGTELISPPVEVQAAPAQHWRLRLDPQSPALDPAQLQVHLQWPQPWVAFVARGPMPLQLAVGQARMSAATLPLDTLLPQYRKGAESELPVASLGPLTARPEVTPSLLQRLRDAGPAEHKRWTLWAVLAGAVLLLAGLARNLRKDMDQRAAPRDPPRARG